MTQYAHARTHGAAFAWNEKPPQKRLCPQHSATPLRMEAPRDGCNDYEAGGPPEEEQALLTGVADSSTSSCCQPATPAALALPAEGAECTPTDGAECRICCSGAPPLHSLCGCRGSVQWLHDHCAQRWCDEKGNNTCELCQQPMAGVSPRAWHPAPVTAALLALSLRYARAAEEVESGSRRRVSGWAVAALSAAGLFLLFQAVDVSQEADQQNRTFYAGLLRAALILAPLLFFLHMIAAIRRRRAAQQQALLAGQMAAGIALATVGGHSRGGYDDDSSDSIPLALLAHAVEHNLANARPRIDDIVLHATLHEAEQARERNEAAILAAVDAAVLRASRGAVPASPGGHQQQGDDAA